MKVVVAVRAVATLDDEVELVDGETAVDPDGLEWDLNEWDAFSLEEALTLRDAAGDGEVVAVTVGDEEAHESLIACLAKGADPLAVARVLAAAIERESPDLVLCGVQSSDAVNGATGVATAAHLGLPHVAVVKGLALEDGVATVERELEGGLVEVLRIGLPALLTIQTGINEPRYATLRAIKQAREKPLGELGLEDVGLDADAIAAATGSRTRRLRHHDRGAGAEMLDGSAADVAARIADIVKERMSG